MLRLLVILLVLANGAFWAWSQGALSWLEPLLPAPASAEREPERLAKQVRAQNIVVLNPKAAAQAANAANAAQAAQGASAADAAASRGADGSAAVPAPPR